MAQVEDVELFYVFVNVAFGDRLGYSQSFETYPSNSPSKILYASGSVCTMDNRLAA